MYLVKVVLVPIYLSSFHLTQDRVYWAVCVCRWGGGGGGEEVNQEHVHSLFYSVLTVDSLKYMFNTAPNQVPTQ